MILVECSVCSRKHLLHPRRASHGEYCECGSWLNIDPPPQQEPVDYSHRLARPTAPYVPDATPARPYKFRMMLSVSAGAVALLAVLWLGMANLRDSAKRSYEPGSIHGTLDRRSVKPALPMVVTGVELIDANGTKHYDVIGYGSGFVVSPDGHVVTSRTLVRDVLKVQQTDREVHTLNWYAKYLLRNQFAANVRKHVFVLEHASMLKHNEETGTHATEMAAIKKQLVDIDSGDPALILRMSNKLREKYSNITPKVWLMFSGLRDTLEVKQQFIPTSDVLDVAVLKYDGSFDAFFQMRRSLPSEIEGMEVVACGYQMEKRPASANDTPLLDKFVDNLATRRNPRGFFRSNGSALELRLGTAVGTSLVRGPDGSRLFQIEHNTGFKSRGGGALLDSEGTVVGITTSGGDSKHALSVPGMFESLKLYLPHASWVD